MCWTGVSAWIEEANSVINRFVWGPYLLLPLLLGVGINRAIRTQFVQSGRVVRRLREAAGKIFRRSPSAEADITPFQTLNVAMGGTVGVDNIAGVATAIAMGGPGAVFQMWVSGLLGMGTKYAEVVLGQHYRTRAHDGPMIGGPITYISRGMGRRWR